MHLRSVWDIQWLLGQLRLQYETLSQKKSTAYKLVTIQHMLQYPKWTNSDRNHV